MKEAAPVHTRSPANNQTETPLVAEETCLLTSDGAEKIPDPIWRLTTRARPFKYVREPRVPCIDVSIDREPSLASLSDEERRLDSSSGKDSVSRSLCRSSLRAARCGSGSKVVAKGGPVGNLGIAIKISVRNVMS
jgi:hypothetical protein